MKIRVFGHSGEGQFPFGNSGPWLQFKNTLIRNHHEIVDSNLEMKADAVIANTHNSNIEHYLQKFDIPIQRRVLVIWEPLVVDSARYLPRVTKQYGHVFAPSFEWAEIVGGEDFKWPQDIIDDSDVLANWSQRKNKAVIIQGNKFSAHRGELYSLRRKVIHSKMSSFIDVYGTNWNSGLAFDWWHWSRSVFNVPLNNLSLRSIQGIGRSLNNYHGVIESKHQTYLNYQIAIVIENSADFVSEKLFDAVRAGCLVLYVGAELERYDLPADTIFRVKPERRDIIDKLKNISELSLFEKTEIVSRQLSNFMKISDEWHNDVVLRNLAVRILKKIEF